ncbi:MAG TPA: protein kinase [Jiangellaceae bacterium]|nr:protein kinase [Jiangellaceae bacterium]
MGGVIAGRYELGRERGSGGMARVVEAIDRRLGRRVAMKLLDATASDPATRERFVREARSAASVSHPNAVTVYDTGEDNGLLYIAMELVDGPTLADLLAERGPLDPTHALTIASEVLGALEAGHVRGLVHRDVKPGNILLAPDGSAKLTDFGIAKSVGAVTAALTMTGEVVGTPQYLSPEQAAGRAATPASDIYAVGLVLYEMLAGAPPFTGDTPLATVLAHQQEPVPPLTTRPGLSAALATAVIRALAKAPRDRYPDAAAMRAAITSPALASVACTTSMTQRERTLIAPTDTMAAAVPASGVRPRRWFEALLAGIALLFLAGVLSAALVNGGEDPAQQANQTPSSTSTSASASSSMTATTAPTAPPGPATIADLTVALAAGPPEAYGEKGLDLLDKLQKVQRETAEKRVEEAANAIEEISKWVDEAKLEPLIAQAAIEVLRDVR